MAGFASASMLPAVLYRDRRRQARKAVLDSSLVSVEMGTGAFGVMLDVSEEGLGMQVMGGLPPGTEVRLAFNIPDSPKRVEGTGLVNWFDGRGRVGLSIRELKPATQDAFRRWVNSLPEPITPEFPAKSADEKPSLTEQAQTIKQQIANHQLDFDLVLQHLIDKTVEMTGASGGAVALESNGNMVCRASAGLAPEVGVSIDPSSALTSECIRTASVVKCDDTEVDPRVDREICRQLSLRSSLILPIKMHGLVKGVLEVFSSRPYAFSDQHLLMLKQLADFTAEVMQETGTAEAAAGRETADVARPVLRRPLGEPFPVEKAVVEAPVTPEPASTIPVVERRSKESLPETGTSPPPGVPSLPISVKTAAPAESPSEIAAGPVEEKEELEGILSELKEQPGRDPRIIPLIALLVLATIVAGVWFYGRARRVTAAPQPVVVEAAPAKVETTSTTPKQQDMPLPIDSLPIRSGSASGGSATASESNDGAKETATPKQKVSPPPELPQDTVRNVPVARVVPPPAQRVSNQEAALDALSATGMGGAPEIGSMVLPSIVTTPRLGSQGVSGGMLLHRVEPDYPAMARRLRMAGDVQLSAHVTKTGMVEDVKKISGSAILADASIKAVKQWRYEPYRVNGEPQEVEVSITLHFRLPN